MGVTPSLPLKTLGWAWSLSVSLCSVKQHLRITGGYNDITSYTTHFLSVSTIFSDQPSLQMSQQPPPPSSEPQNITQESTGTENSVELNENFNGASNDENVKIIEESPSNAKAETGESKLDENNDVAVP